jgi:hypothetical protein
MVPTREDVKIEEMFCALVGSMIHGVMVYGPFNTTREAFEYCSKNFLKGSWEIASIYKEITNASN